MRRAMQNLGALALCVAATWMSSTPASAITRSEVIAAAKAYAYHPWRATTANSTASCSAAYKSLFGPGDYLGLPYNWGGYQTQAEFDKRIADGLAAGAQETDGVLSCTAGVDCSGFVSSIWRVGHFTTSSMAQTSDQIQQTALIAGDVMNKAGYHVAMFNSLLANGEPDFYEAAGYNTHYNAFGGWSYVSGYIPRRYSGLEGTSATDVVGSATSPIAIPAFPYTDSRDTKQSLSRALDRCVLAPNSSEAGPEYIYTATFTKPGTLTVSVADDASADIDVHVYTNLNANDCVARGDTTVTYQVDCGKYYIVADTYGTSSGAYNLNATFTPSGSACGAGPPQYNYKGHLGDACGYPGNPSLPFCNATLGADTCVYTSTTSFCSKPCATNNDCAGLAGACCQDLGNQELYCVTAALCGGSSMVNPNPTTGPEDGGTSVTVDQGSSNPNGPADGTDPGNGSPGKGSGCSFGGDGPASGLFGIFALLSCVLVLRRRVTA